MSALSVRIQTGIVVAALASYWLGFTLFPPSALGISDEVYYVHQAQAFASGRLADTLPDPLTGQLQQVVPSTYPVGTSLLQSPFVRLGGWRAAPLASAVALTAAVLLLARWIVLAGGAPLAALLFLGFPPTLVLGRTAMSDVPGALVVTLGLWLFWLGQESVPSSGAYRRSHSLGFAAGLCAGLSLLFRETNALLFAPLFVGVLLRRKPGALAIVLGSLVGIAVRLTSAYMAYGDPLFVRPNPGLSLQAIATSAPLYLFALMVFIPAGLPAALAYRGPRRLEILVTTLLYLAFFLTYSFSGVESGGLKRLVVGPRFFIPLAALLAFAAACTIPVWLARQRGGTRVAVGLYTAGVIVAAFAVHVVHDRWSRSQAGMMKALHRAMQPDEVVVTNLLSTAKLLPEPGSERLRMDLAQMRAEDVAVLTADGRKVVLAVLDRSDTPFFLERSAENARFVARVTAMCRLTLRHDGSGSATDRLRIWGVEACKSAPGQN